MSKFRRRELGPGARSLASAIILAALPTAFSEPAFAEDWTGLYAGGQIGWTDLEYPTSSPGFPGGISFAGNGSLLGVHVGYNHDFGALVLGAELSVDFPSVDIRFAPTGVPGRREIDSVTAVKAKAGYDAGRFLPYAVIGYASQGFNDTSGLAEDLTFDGMTYGVGMSYLASPNLVTGIEALWFDLDPTDPATGLTSEGSVVNLRLSYKF